MIGLVKRTSLKINNINIYTEDNDFVPRHVFSLPKAKGLPFLHVHTAGDSNLTKIPQSTIPNRICFLAK